MLLVQPFELCLRNSVPLSCCTLPMYQMNVQILYLICTDCQVMNANFIVSVPSQHQWLINLLLLLIHVGVLPPYQEAHTYVSQQREGQFEDLKHALTIMKRLSETDDLAQQICNMFLLEEGGMRFVRVPKVCTVCVSHLHALSCTQWFDQYSDHHSTLNLLSIDDSPLPSYSQL